MTSSLSSQVIVMTGATGGIGQLAALDLAKRGAHLVLIARSQSKAAVTREMISSVAPSARVDFHFADLASLADVRRVGHAISMQYGRIDVLINNAGLHAFKPRSTVDGFGEMMAVNYLAPWLLTNILRDRLVGAAPARVITVASEASRRAGPFELTIDVFKNESFSRLGSSRIYGRTKLMEIMFSLELARQLEGTGVAVNCLDPGFNVTGLGRELSFAALLERVLRWLKIGDPRRGAGIIVRLASDPKFANISGGYFSVQHAKSLEPVAPANSLEARLELWRLTASVIATNSS